MSNFFTQMTFYLKSRVTSDSYHQVYLVYKLFLLVFLLPRLVRLFFCTSTSSSDERSPHRRFEFMNRRPCLLLIKQNLKLYLIAAKLCFISVYQFTSTHFRDNFKLMMFNSKLNDSSSSERLVKLDRVSMFEFCFVYPILLGNVLPLVTSKLDDLTSSNSSMVKNQSLLLVALVWSMVTLGASASLFLSNHLGYYLDTSNVFVYSNLVHVLVFVLVLFVYSCLNYKQQKMNKTTASFLQANSSMLGMLNSFSSLKKSDLDDEITRLNEN